MLGEPRVRKTTRAYDYSSVLRTRRFYAGVALRTSRLAHAWFNRSQMVLIHKNLDMPRMNVSIRCVNKIRENNIKKHETCIVK